MTIQRNQVTTVYYATSLAQIRKIEARHEARGIRYLLMRALIVVWVTLANAALSAVKWLLFRRGRLPRKETRSIVAYATGTLGDSIVTLSSLAGLRKAFPSASISVIVNAAGYDPALARRLFQEVQWLDRVIVLRDDPVKRKGLMITVTYPLGERIACDLFVNFSSFGNTGWLGAVVREIIFAKWMGSERVIGFSLNAYNRHGVVLNKVKHHFVRNEPRRASEVLREIGLTPVEGADVLPRSASALAAIGKKLGDAESGSPIFVINPGAKFKIKCWPAERFAALATRLRREYGGCVVITGLASERPLGDEILRRAGGLGINLAGQTSVQELIELLRLCTACITNDTGTMHIAAELNKPTVAIFTTRISPTHWFPKGEKVIAVFSFSSHSYSYKDDGDAPCECLTQIGVEDVFSGLRSVLSSAPISKTV